MSDFDVHRRNAQEALAEGRGMVVSPTKLLAILDAPRTVFAVEWGNEFPSEIDSLWSNGEEAQKRADELNARAIRGADNYAVRQMSVREIWEPEA